MWQKVCIALAVLCSVAGGLISPTDAYLKTCKLNAVPASAADNVMAYNFFIGTSAAGTLTALPFQVTPAELPIVLSTLGMDQSGVTYQVAASAQNAGGEGPRSAILQVPIDSGSTPPPVAAPGPPSLSVVCP